MKPRIKVELLMADEADGGRPCGFSRGYCPHFVSTGQTDWLGVRALTPAESSPTSIPFHAEFSLMYWPALDYSALAEGSTFVVMEGPRIVGSGRVLSRLPDHEHPRLYCPRCGVLMTRADSGVLKCQNGDMALSEKMEEELITRYIECARTAALEVFTHANRPHGVGGNWHCPVCGSPIIESAPGVLTCLECRQSIVDLVYDLVSRHPHK